VLLALAAAIDPVNGVLSLWVLLELALGPQRRSAAVEAAWVLGVAALLAGPFFLWLALGADNAQDAACTARLYLEYHLGDVPTRGSRAELVLAILFTTLLFARALRDQPRAVSRLLMWTLLLATRSFFYQRWHPESSGPSGLCFAVVVALGLLARGRLAALRAGTAALLLGVLLGLHIRSQKEARAEALAVRDFVGAEARAAAPLHDLVCWLDATLERDALLSVSPPLLASYFQIYTQRQVAVRDYLDVSAERLRTECHLTTLGLRFYNTAWTRQALNQAAQAGRPIYLLSTEEDPLPRTLRLPWRGLRLSRLSPE
jgi:hypothetical protein